MKYELTAGTAFPLVEIILDRGEKIKLERGAMVYHNGQIHLEGKMNSNGKAGIGGVLSALGRSMTSGESFFISQASGLEDQAKIAIAPPSVGSIRELEVGDIHWRLNTGVFLACDDSVTYNMKKQKLSGALFGGTGGFFVMETAGRGSLLVTSFGDLVELDLDGQIPFIIDNEHVVAWEDSLDYDIRVASGTFGFTTGEGLVNEFHGRGKVLIQTRNLQGLAGALAKFIPSSSGS
ncbi:TIGR00266 family protein [uncultured Vagococcus sp.]|uniref:TIGR00266 family protein n=1 Tax=uncultured Vagococcus sp. TaxID=189676 RepID=UPI0028D048CA|nr:TIGR00266 family protein [uncultured Vagococcus sp.]